jgi:3-isopropylmalate dehydrogenase
LTSYRVAVIGGDGIGPEVVEAARRVLEAAGERFGFALAWTEVVAGGAAIDAYGTALRDEDLASCADADAVLLGAVGGPRWDDPAAEVRPEQALFVLRQRLGLFANLRPIVGEPLLAEASPLRPERLRGVDMLIVRELTGGLYFGERTEHRTDQGDRQAVDTLPYSEAEIRRVARLAFELADNRRGRLTSVDKANVLATSRLWRTVVTEIGRDYPRVILEHRLVDAFAMHLITHPSAFDVVVTENLFGDILSDEASVLTGSLGMLPSASLGDRRTRHGLFGLYEPVHGSAPDIAGHDVANPVGAIRSAAMMMRWSLARADAASSIEAAIRAALGDGMRTADLCADETQSAVGTRAFTDAVIERLGAPTSPGVRA